MRLKASLKSSDASIKARSDSVISLSDAKIAEYESKISRLELERDNSFMSGFNQGNKALYDKFWDSFQENGKLREYAKVFSGLGWNDITFTPKYDIIASVSAANMFSNNKITDLTEALKRAGVKLSTRGASRVDYMFYKSEVTNIPEIDASAATNLIYMFYTAANLHTVKKLILANDGSQDISNNVFHRCTSLKNITFKGLIGSNLDMSYCPLSKESIVNLVPVLSTDVDFRTVKLSKAAVDKAFETTEFKMDGSVSSEWEELIRFRPMWDFVLV